MVAISTHTQRSRPLEASCTYGIALVSPCYNEREHISSILENLESIAGKYPFEVHLIDDGSTDGTRDIMDLYVEDFPETNIIFHYMLQNGQKVGALKEVVRNLDSQVEYVVFTDADTKIVTPEKILDAIEYCEERDLAGVATKVRPMQNGKNAYQDMLIALQDVDYANGRLVARVTTSPMKGLSDTSVVRCVAGAGGVISRAHAEAALEFHSGKHAGDDMETTAIIQLIHGGKIGYFPDMVFETDAPKTYTELIKQRARWERGALDTFDRLGPLYLSQISKTGKYGFITAYEWALWGAIPLSVGLAANDLAHGRTEYLQNYLLADLVLSGIATGIAVRKKELSDNAAGLVTTAALPFYKAAVSIPSKAIAVYKYVKDKIAESTSFSK